MTPDDAGCLPGVYTDDAGDNTDHPGLRSGMIRDAIRECVKAPLRARLACKVFLCTCMLFGELVKSLEKV